MKRLLATFLSLHTLFVLLLFASHLQHSSLAIQSAPDPAEAYGVCTQVSPKAAPRICAV